MRVTRNRLAAGVLVLAIVASVLPNGLPFGLARGHALASVNLGCTATVTGVPNTPVSLSTPGNPSTVTLTVSGGQLDKGTQVYLLLYDSNGDSSSLIPQQSAMIDSNGNYNSTAVLPTGGVAGGSDQIVVADYGLKCATAPITINPVITTTNTQGTSFSFNGAGFHSGSTLTIAFTPQGGAAITLGTVSATNAGGVSAASIGIPGGPTPLTGAITVTDAQHSASNAVPFNFSGVPPSPTNGPPNPEPTYTPNAQPPIGTGPGPGGGGQSPPTNTPVTSNTFVPFVTNTPTTPTNTPRPGSTSTWTPVPTSTRFGSQNPGFPTSTPTTAISGQVFPTTTGGFPKPTSTPRSGFPSPTPTPRSTHRGPRCGTGALVDGDFSNGLTCWHTSSSSAVSVQPSAKNSKTRAARIAGAVSPTLLSQSFKIASGMGSVTFSYQNLAKGAVAQLSGSGGVLVGRRLLSTKVGSYLFGVLPIPAGIGKGQQITVSFTSQHGTLLVKGVALSKWPSGQPPPAKKTVSKTKTTNKKK